jgi:hypothetical protein
MRRKRLEERMKVKWIMKGHDFEIALPRIAGGRKQVKQAVLVLTDTAHSGPRFEGGLF